jgi:NTE family protein
VRHAAVASRLTETSWPSSNLKLTAIDAGTGGLTVFTKDSNVDLIDAVAASCAVPGVWPPVTIGDRRYIDGGVRSGTNADLAEGCDRVLILTPTQESAPQPWGSLSDEIAKLSPAVVNVIYGDEASTAAFGTNPLSPSSRGPAAREGQRIGIAQAADIASFWF